LPFANAYHIDFSPQLGCSVLNFDVLHFLQKSQATVLKTISALALTES
jgi:hypothetical protein